MFPAILEEARGRFELIEAEMKERSASQDVARLGVIHGDFWSGKYEMHLSPSAVYDMQPLQSRTQSAYSLLTGNYLISQLQAKTSANALRSWYLPSHFRGVDAGLYMIEAFLEAYGKMADEEAYEVALRFGVHLVVWPCRSGENDRWGTKEQLVGCVEVGRDFVRNAWEKNREWFRGGVLEKL
ncbi:MAG: hypothetical protein Q9187_008414, partial [Circinaria calcarea]